MLAEGAPEGAHQRLHQILQRGPAAHRDQHLDGHPCAQVEALPAMLLNDLDLVARHGHVGGEIGLAGALVVEGVRRNAPTARQADRGSGGRAPPQ